MLRPTPASSSLIGLCCSTPPNTRPDAMASLHDPAGAAPKRRKLSASSSSEEDEEMLAANAAEAAAMQME